MTKRAQRPSRLILTIEAYTEAFGLRFSGYRARDVLNFLIPKRDKPPAVRWEPLMTLDAIGHEGSYLESIYDATLTLLVEQGTLSFDEVDLKTGRPRFAIVDNGGFNYNPHVHRGIRLSFVREKDAQDYLGFKSKSIPALRVVQYPSR